MCSARAELTSKIRGWSRRTDRLPLIAGGKQNRWMRPKMKCVVDGGNQCRFPQRCSAHSILTLRVCSCCRLMDNHLSCLASKGLPFLIPPLSDAHSHFPVTSFTPAAPPSRRTLQSTNGHCSSTAPLCPEGAFHPSPQADLIYAALLWITQTLDFPPPTMHATCKLLKNIC